MTKEELRYVVDRLADNATMVRTFNKIAEGASSPALDEAAGMLIKALAYNSLGRYLTDDEFGDVAKAIGERLSAEWAMAAKR